MILVLFLCIIIMIIMLLVIFITVSAIRFRIEDFEIANAKHIIPHYRVIISLKLLNKIKWLSFSLNAKKMKKMYTKMHLERIDIKKIERDLSFEDIKELLKIKPKMTRLNLKLKIGVDDVVITSYIVPIICSLLSITLPQITREENIKDIKYKIEPAYNMKNIYHLKLTTTLEIKVSNILSSIYNIHKNRKQNKKLCIN